MPHRVPHWVPHLGWEWDMSASGASVRPKHAPEDEVQYAVARVLDALGVLWCHVANEALQREGDGSPEARRHSMIFGGILVGLGVKTGVPDVLIFDPPPVSPDARGVAIELKSQVGSASPDQKRWLAALEDRGWVCRVQKGTQAALDTLRFLGWDVDGALSRLAETGQVLTGDRMSRPSKKAAAAAKGKAA